MKDQASTLRLIVSNDQPQLVPKKPRMDSPKMKSVAISGGKGGVGKSNLAVNLALELGAVGKNTTILDADLGLANADLICGVTPEHHLGHVVAGWKSLEEISIYLSSNVRLIPGGSGIAKLADMSLKEETNILEEMQELESSLDFLIIDTAAGVAENVMNVIDAADIAVIVATPEPTSIVDAYATIKVIANRSPEKDIRIVINRVIGIGDAEEVFNQIKTVVRQFLNKSITFLGMIPNDDLLIEAVKEQKPIVRLNPETPASRAIRMIAQSLARHSHSSQSNEAESAGSFWNRLVSKN